MPTEDKTKDQVDRLEYMHAESMFIEAMITIQHFLRSHRPPVRIGYEAGLAHQYYEQILLSEYATSPENPNRKLVLSLCKEYDKILDEILPLRRMLKEVD